MNRNCPRIEQVIRETIQQYYMCPPGTALVVGCSGGADSMTLLHFLMAEGYPVVAAHVNHQLRGAEAMRDEEFVRDFCRERNIPLHITRKPVASLAHQNNQSVEECGRAVRYEFFRSLCRPPISRIATAHTRSDSVETVLFHLAKGAGPRGLMGIPAVREEIVRPLIRLSRSDIEEYCRCHDVPYIQDSSNFSRDYTRNRIRLDVVPVLRELNPAFETAVERMSRQIEDDDIYLTKQAQAALDSAKVAGGYDSRKLAPLPRPIQSRAVRLAVLEHARKNGYPSLRLTYAQIEQVCHDLRSGSGGAALPNGFYLRVEPALLSFDQPEPEPVLWNIPYEAPQIFTFNQHTVRISVENCANSKNPNNIHKLLFQNSLDYDTIASNAAWRNRQPGDRFSPSGRNLSKPLKKLFNEAKIPPSRRDQVLLLESAGEIVWIEGFGPAHGYGVSERTKKAVRIYIEE